jgi:hypothetical protein
MRVADCRIVSQLWSIAIEYFEPLFSRSQLVVALQRIDMRGAPLLKR